MTETTNLLGTLRKRDLREAWKHEASHFTRWLAQEQNLSLLGDALGFDISLIQIEAAVGSFNVDILAEEETTKRKIIIENQLETTNHDHLGKIITYASGYDAQVVVWIVKDAREEHRQAIDWLNEHTDENTEFYLLRIELWQIGDSPLAPKFELVSKPNDWAKAVRSSTDSGKLTDTKSKQLEFWTQLQQFAMVKGTVLHIQKPSPQHWTNVSVGSSQANIALTVNSREGFIGAELYIPNSKPLFQKLLAQKDIIEKELGEAGQWQDLPGKKASRIRYVSTATFEDSNTWESSFAWLLRMAEAIHRVFPKYIKANDD